MNKKEREKEYYRKNRKKIKKYNLDRYYKNHEENKRIAKERQRKRRSNLTTRKRIKRSSKKGYWRDPEKKIKQVLDNYYKKKLSQKKH